LKFASGKNALSYCDACGMQYPYRLLVHDGYNPKLRVHPSCRDEPHPAEKPVRLDEGIALKNPRPDRDDDSPGTAVDHSGTAQAGSANSLTLATNASSVASDYINGTLALTGGAGSEQSRTILGYNGSTKVAQVATWNAGYLSLSGTSGNYASTPDSAAVSITGDIDIRVKVAMDDWTPGSLSNVLVGKYGAQGQWAYALTVSSDGPGLLSFHGSVDGSTQSVLSSSVPTGFVNGSPHWVRVTRSATELKFYTSEDGVTWTQLGTDQMFGFAGSIFDSTAALRVWAWEYDSRAFSGKVYYAELRNGIDGTVVAKFDPNNDRGTSDTSFTSSTGEVWTINQSGSPAAELIAGIPNATTEYTVTVPDTLAEAMGFTNSFGGAT